MEQVQQEAVDTLRSTLIDLEYLEDQVTYSEGLGCIHAVSLAKGFMTLTIVSKVSCMVVVISNLLVRHVMRLSGSLSIWELPVASSGATATSSHVQIRCQPCIDVDGVAKAAGNCPTSQGRRHGPMVGHNSAIAGAGLGGSSGSSVEEK